MKWLEIIEIRATNTDPGKLKSILGDLAEAEDIEQPRPYYRLNVDNDFSVHLCHDSKTIPSAGSPLGLRLAASLREHGLVNHNIWIQVNTGNEGSHSCK